MNELQAAYGILQLKTITQQIAKREIVDKTYRESLSNINGISLLNIGKGVKHNFSYFPILVDQDKYGKSRDDLYQELKDQNIFGRRYYYPLISNFSAYKGLTSANRENLPIANRISEQVICLPIYPDIEEAAVKRIINVIK